MTIDHTTDNEGNLRAPGYWLIDAEGDDRMSSPYSDMAAATEDYWRMVGGGDDWLLPSERPLAVVHIAGTVTAEDITPPPAPKMVSIRLDDLEALLAFHKEYARSGRTERLLRQRCHIAASYARKDQS